MSIKYVYTEAGTIERVVAPIEYWNSIVQSLQKPHKKPFDPAAFRGKLVLDHIPNLADALAKLRSEWGRNI